MKLWSILGNSQKLDGGAMYVRPMHGPHPARCAGPPSASEFVPDKFVGNAGAPT